MTSEPKLSLCMIVKNEEVMLPICLNSVIGCMDEIIMVDTGSTDRTIDIAQKYKVRLYHHPWKDNFSKHRNQSIDYATGDWIFQMDADEELAEGSCRIIREAIRDQEADAFLVTILSFFNNGTSSTRESKIRIFRKKPSIRYESTIHEQIRGYKCAKVIPAKIFHYGYDREREVLEKKLERTTQLVNKQIKEEPDNYFHHLNLAVCYLTNFTFKEAIEEGILALQLAENKGIQGPNVLWGYYIVSSAYMKLDDLDNAEKYALKAINLSPNHLDSYFVLTLVYHSKKNWEKLVGVAHEFLRVRSLLDTSPEMFASSIIHMACEEWRIHIALGDIYLHQNEIEKAEKEFDVATVLAPNKGDCNRIIGDCFRNIGSWERGEEHYKLSLGQQKDDPETIFGLALIYKDINHPGKYKELIGKIKESDICRADIFFEKGLIHLKDRNYKSAIKYFNKAIELKCDYYSAYVNLALGYKYMGEGQKAVETNLKAIELQPDSTDARANLGHLYYEMKEFKLAKEMFESVLELDPGLVDIRIFLCEISLMAEDVEYCVYMCDEILRSLNLPRDMTLNNVTELAGLFFVIGHVLAKRGRPMLSGKALNLAHKFDPQIESKIKMLSNGY